MKHFGNLIKDRKDKEKMNEKEIQLKELRQERDKINEKIEKIENERMRERLKKNEKNYLGKCYENENMIIKVVCAASGNEYRVGIIGFEKEPMMENEQDLFDNSFRRHPFQGRTNLNLVIEDDIMISDLRQYQEITNEVFHEKLKEITEKLSKEMDVVFELDCGR